MNSLELEIDKFTSNGGAHVKLNSDRENLGILYLTAEQFKVIKNVLTAGCFNHGVDFTIKNPFDLEDEEDDDIFDLRDFSENKT